MQRYFIEISFSGSQYSGWQVQPQSDTIQYRLNDALSTILQEQIYVTGAGRTDAGVHASFFMAHFDSGYNQLEGDHDLIYHLNHYLPMDIAVHRLYKVHHEAHSRFDAISRSYKYIMGRSKDPFLHQLKYLFEQDLNEHIMQQGAEMLLQYTNFASFCKGRTDVQTYNCNIYEAYWYKTGHDLIFFIRADRFLRNMVRAIVGTLLNLGKGKIDRAQFRDIIESQDRRRGGYSVPAKGLYLMDITYPPDIFIA